MRRWSGKASVRITIDVDIDYDGHHSNADASGPDECVETRIPTAISCDGVEFPAEVAEAVAPFLQRSIDEEDLDYAS